MINAGHSRLVLVSGRGIGDLQQLLGLRQPIEIWGAHGLERLHVDGNYEVGKLDEAAASGLLQARQHVENFAPASQYESKPGSLALHWRGLAQPKIKEIQGALAGHWIEIAQRANLILTEFDGGMELRVSGVNKGSAVRTVLNEMKDDAAAAFLGDDVTDEDAFAALSGKGAGILVREELRPTAADLWLKPPEELMQFLENWHKISGGV